MNDNMQIINIDQNKIPIIHMKTNTKVGQMFGTQGIVCLVQPKTDNNTLRSLILKNKPEIINCFKGMTKPVNMERSEEEYMGIIQKYIEKYRDQLQVYPDKIRHSYIKPDHLGWAYINNTITYNKYMKYMDEEQIKLTVYHELCHLYTLKYDGTFAHDEDFFNILYKEFSPEEEKRILEN